MLKKFKARKPRWEPKKVKIISTLKVHEKSQRIATQVNNLALGQNQSAADDNVQMKKEGDLSYHNWKMLASWTVRVT